MKLFIPGRVLTAPLVWLRLLFVIPDRENCERVLLSDGTLVGQIFLQRGSKLMTMHGNQTLEYRLSFFRTSLTALRTTQANVPLCFGSAGSGAELMIHTVTLSPLRRAY